MEAIAKIHHALSPSPNAPPEFVVYPRSRTCGITTIGGRPGSVDSAQSFVARSRA
jgi:hypothetical protein